SSRSKESTRKQTSRAPELGPYDDSSNHSSRTRPRDSGNLDSSPYPEACGDHDPTCQNGNGSRGRCCNTAGKPSQGCRSRKKVHQRESARSFCEGTFNERYA